MAEPEHLKPVTAEGCFALERAICGAIGWIAAGTNEGNHQIAKETINRLTAAAAYFRQKGDGLANADRRK